MDRRKFTREIGKLKSALRFQELLADKLNVSGNESGDTAMTMQSEAVEKAEADYWKAFDDADAEATTAEDHAFIAQKLSDAQSARGVSRA